MLLFLFLIGSITACSVSDDTANDGPVYIYVPVTAVNGPTTATVNQEITLNVSYRVETTCGIFHSFYQEGGTNTEPLITILAQYTRGEDCETIPTTKIAPYKFKATAAGTYILKFRYKNGITADSFVTQTIVVS